MFFFGTLTRTFWTIFARSVLNWSSNRLTAPHISNAICRFFFQQDLYFSPKQAPPPFGWTTLTRNCHHVALGSHLGPNGLVFFHLLRVSPLVGKPTINQVATSWRIETLKHHSIQSINSNPGAPPPEKSTTKRCCDLCDENKHWGSSAKKLFLTSSRSPAAKVCHGVLSVFQKFGRLSLSSNRKDSMSMHLLAIGGNQIQPNMRQMQTRCYTNPHNTSQHGTKQLDRREFKHVQETIQGRNIDSFAVGQVLLQIHPSALSLCQQNKVPSILPYFTIFYHHLDPHSSWLTWVVIAFSVFRGDFTL